MRGTEKYKHLFSPIKVNQMMLPNRIFAAPANGGYSKERATGGAAVNLWGCGTVDLKNAGMIGEVPYMFSKYQYQKTRRILDFMKQGGSKASLEMMHAGMMRRGENNVGPSDAVNPEGLPVRALKEEELYEIAEAFGKAVRDAKEFGFDMVMLHFAHGWLPAEFLSPAWNKRTDEYGGSYENRARFPLMILKKVREYAGPDYPIDMRISVKEWVKDEIEFEDVLHFIKDAENYIDMVNLSAGTDMDKEGCVHMTTTALEDRMTNIEFARAVKEQVSIPVAVVGSIMTPEDAERLIAEGYTDIVMLGRALIADPFWIKKAREGRSEDIVPCIRCGYCSHWATGRYNHGCSVNPRHLRDDWTSYTIPKDSDKRKFVIVGGGPAGMRAALTACERGHDVTLIEKRDRLGGNLTFTDYAGHKQDLRLYKDYLVRQIEKSGVKVQLGTEADADLIRSLDPEVLILAVGASPVIPPVRGIEKGILATDAYKKLPAFGDRVVLIGGGIIACELALELDDGDREITVIEAGSRLHRQDNHMLDIAMDQHLARTKKVTIRLNCSCREIKEKEVILSDGTVIPCDQVIVATGMKANSAQVEALYGIVPETYTVGDCVKSAKIKEANDSAYFVALNV